MALAYLRVMTGCVDGKLRVFCLLSGDCLRVIKAGSRLSPILSVHFHGNKYVSPMHDVHHLRYRASILFFCLVPLQNSVLNKIIKEIQVLIK